MKNIMDELQKELYTDELYIKGTELWYGRSGKLCEALEDEIEAKAPRI